MDGFYAAFMTGRAGISVLLIVIRGNVIVGVDVGGLQYDGTIEETATGYRCSVVYVVPPGAALITGAPPPSQPVRIPVSFELTRGFADGRIVTITTPLGPVNAKFQKLRDL
jgi:hypothetical protein